jgi:hypothetical protein
MIAPLCAIMPGAPASAQAVRAAARTEAVRRLSAELRSNSKADLTDSERQEQKANSEGLFRQLDGLVAESFRPAATTAGSLAAGISAALAYPSAANLIRNVGLVAALPAGRFMILGIDLWRGVDNAISFRAYVERHDTFVPVSHTDIWSGFTDLHADALASPLPGEFWFIARAAGHLAPPNVSIRLYAFDGRQFRTVWELAVIPANGPEDAVEVTPDGFIVNRLFDPSGQAALAPTLVAHERYVLTPDGPQKTGKWETPRGFEKPPSKKRRP